MENKNIQISTLSGGVRIITENLPHVQSFSLGFWFDTGTRDENQKNNGVSHFIEHMVFKGTRKRTAKMISDEIESTGGYLNAFTSKEHTCFYGRGLVENIEKTFDVVSDMIQYPLFKERDIKKEIGVVVDELNDISDNPDELIFDKFEEIIFSKNSLNMPVIGKEENIKMFNREFLQNYFHQNYSSNLMIVCSGNITHKEVLNLTQKYIQRDFKTLKLNRKEPKNLLSSITSVEKDFQQVHCIIGRGSYGYKDDKRIILNIISTLLGDGSSSRLFQSVREKRGITYQIHTFLNSFYDVSSFGIYFSTNENQVEKVVDVIFKEIQKLKQKSVKEKELNRVKEYLKGSMILSLENTTNRMIRLANSMLYFNRVISIEELISKLDLVKCSDVMDLAHELLDEAYLTQVYLKTRKKN